MTDFIIRQATEADYEQLCDLFALLDSGPPRGRAEIARLIAGPRSAILVASEKDARVLHGTATLLVREGHGVEIADLVVHRGARGRGIARALMTHAAGWAERKGHGGAETREAAVSP